MKKSIAVAVPLLGLAIALLVFSISRVPSGDVNLSAQQIKDIKIGTSREEIKKLLGIPRFERPANVPTYSRSEPSKTISKDGFFLQYSQEDSFPYSTDIYLWFVGESLNEVFAKRHFLGLDDVDLYSLMGTSSDISEDFGKVFKDG